MTDAPIGYGKYAVAQDDFEPIITEFPSSLATWAPVGEVTYDLQLVDDDLLARKQLRRSVEELKSLAFLMGDTSVESAVAKVEILMEEMLERYDTLFKLADSLASMSVPMTLGGRT